jgi:Zn-finger nucleic acid-binding protein
MHCPACKTEELAPTQLENGLTGLGCAACGGVLVPVPAARQWAESVDANSWAGHVEAVGISDSAAAMNCPKCAHFMGKFRIDAGVENRLDLCAHCGEFWLDAGEWNLLGALELRQQLPSLFSQPWQLGVRQREAAVDREQRLRDTLGEADHARVQAFATWLSGHPHASLIRRRLAIG